MLETPFSFFISKNTAWNSDIWSFLAKKKSILAYISLKIDISGRPYFITSLWSHTLADFHDFGINEKWRPYPILWYQTNMLWACQFQVHGGNHHSNPSLAPSRQACYFHSTWSSFMLQEYKYHITSQSHHYSLYSNSQKYFKKSKYPLCLCVWSDALSTS